MRRHQVAPPPPARVEGAPVLSVNGQTGRVVLAAGDVGVDPEQVADMAAGKAAAAAAGMIADHVTPEVAAAKGEAGAATEQAAAAAASAANSRTMTINHRNNRENPHEVTAAQLGLHQVATSGSYTDLTDRPVIPVVPAIPTRPSDIGAQPAGSYQPAGNYQPAEVGGSHCQVLFPGWSGELTIPSGLLAGLAGAGDVQAGTVRLISDTPCPYSLELG